METFEEIRAILRDVVLSQKETDLKFKKLAESLEAREKESKRISKQIGEIGNKFGSFTEGLAYPSLRKILFKNYGIENTVANFQKRLPDGNELEFDAFGYTNGSINNAVVVEVKSHLQSKHIYEFKKELYDFKNNFPEFSEKHLFGVLATVKVVSKELKTEIFENGLHLARIHDEIFGFDKNPNAIDFNKKASV